MSTAFLSHSMSLYTCDAPRSLNETSGQGPNHERRNAQNPPSLHKFRISFFSMYRVGRFWAWALVSIPMGSGSPPSCRTTCVT